MTLPPAAPLETPVVFLIFNRPDVTAKVFEAIRAARPRKLLVVADGPRATKAGEAERCRATRAIVDRVDWDCEVRRNFSETNLGCMGRVSSGLDWAFGLEESAIVLEDDCVPHPTFFGFCQELLDRYREDARVMAIAGDNFQFGRRRGSSSYYFSRYNHCWGWASWRRAWRHFDAGMREWPAMRDGGWLMDVLGSARAADYWRRIFDAVSENRIDSWAYRWTFACWRESGLTCLPSVNLVSNIGFSGDATHTRGRDRYADMAVEAVETPLLHPPFVVRDSVADAYTQDTMFASPGLARRVGSRLRRMAGIG